MKIQLIGFDYGIKINKKLSIFKEVINSSDADLILFPGHSIRNEADIDRLCPYINNTNPVVIFELANASPSGCMHTNNELYIYRNGVFNDMYSSQLFATSDDIKGNEVLMGKLFDELPRRTLNILGKRITILQCGETSLLECRKANNNVAEFRFMDNETLNDRYLEMLDSTDIFLNPIHVAQGGRQWLYDPKRVCLSRDGRHYLSTSSLDERSQGKLTSKRIQYIYSNGEQLFIAPEIDNDLGYVCRIVCID